MVFMPIIYSCHQHSLLICDLLLAGVTETISPKSNRSHSNVFPFQLCNGLELTFIRLDSWCGTKVVAVFVVCIMKC